MADTESKRSIRRKANSNSQLAISKPRNNPRKTKTSRSRTPKRRKFSAWRRASQGSYRVEDIRGKTVDLVEFYTTGGFHCLDVRFQDNTALTFTIDPGFTIAAEHSDWTTGDMRELQQWPQVRSSN
jgi:hypothetical protein